METERELLEAIRSGERAALHRLYDRYSDYAMAIGLRYIPERDEVRDVLQDSFVRIFTSISQFNYNGEGSLKSWIGRIGDMPPDTLTEMIGRLPTNYRTVFNLYVFEQWPHRKIAQLMGIKESSSSSIFFRARKMLAKQIREYIISQET